MTTVIILMWIYVIGVLIASIIFGLAFRHAENKEAEMDSHTAKNWNDIKVQAEMRNLSITGFAVLLAFFWPYFLVKGK